MRAWRRSRPASPRLEDARAGAPIRVTAIERELGTRYTVDTLDALLRLYPDRRFVWLMGADNLAQFHLWRDWRKIAALVPIAVVTRPGYAGCCPEGACLGLAASLRPPRGHGSELDVMETARARAARFAA